MRRREDDYDAIDVMSMGSPEPSTLSQPPFHTRNRETGQNPQRPPSLSSPPAPTTISGGVSSSASFSRSKGLPDGSYLVKILAAEELRQVVPLTTDDTIPIMKLTDYIVKSNFSTMQEVVLEEWNTSSFGDVSVRTNLRSEQSTIKCPPFPFLVASVGEIHVIVLEIMNESEEVLAWVEFVGDRVGSLTRFLRLPPVEPAKALEKPHLRVVGPGIDIEICTKVLARRPSMATLEDPTAATATVRRATLAGSTNSNIEPMAGSMSGEGIHFTKQRQTDEARVSPSAIGEMGNKQFSTGVLRNPRRQSLSPAAELREESESVNASPASPVPLVIAPANPTAGASAQSTGRRRRSTKQPGEAVTTENSNSLGPDGLGTTLPFLSPTRLDGSPTSTSLPRIANGRSTSPSAQSSAPSSTGSLEGVTGLPDLSRRTSNREQVMAKSTNIAVDGIKGMPLNAVCTRIRMFLADAVDASSGQPIGGTITSEDLFSALKLTSCQDTNSSCANPNFTSNNDLLCYIGNMSAVVVVVDCSLKDGKGWFTLGHAVLPVGLKQPCGQYCTRIRSGDPTPFVADYKDESARLRSSMSKPPSADDFFPIAYINWRKSSAACGPDPFAGYLHDQLFPLTNFEIKQLDLRDGCVLASPQRTPLSLNPPLGDVRSLFEVALFREDPCEAWSFLAPHVEEEDVFVNVECLLGAPMLAKGLYKVSAEMVTTAPPKANLNRFGMAGQHNFKSPIIVPTFLEDPIVFPKVPLNPCSYMTLRLFSVDTTAAHTNGIKEVGWTITRVFLDDQFLRNGRMVSPIFDKTPPPALLQELRSAASVDDCILRNLQEGKIQFATPRILIRFSQGSWDRVIEVTSKRAHHYPCKAVLIKHIAHEKLARFEVPPSGSMSKPLAGQFGGNADALRLQHETNIRIASFIEEHVTLAEPLKASAKLAVSAEEAPRNAMLAREQRLMSFGSFQSKAMMLASEGQPARSTSPAASPYQSPVSKVGSFSTIGQKDTSPAKPANPLQSPVLAPAEAPFAPVKPVVPRLRSAGAARSNSFSMQPAAEKAIPNQQNAIQSTAADQTPQKVTQQGPPQRLRSASVAANRTPFAPAPLPTENPESSLNESPQQQAQQEQAVLRARSQSVLGGALLSKFRDQMNNDVIQQESNMLGAANGRVLLNVDGVAGLPFSAVFTRVKVYIADRLDTSKQLQFSDNIGSDMFFERPPDVTAYQDTASACSEPTFSSNSQFVTMVSDRTLAVAIVEFARANKTWSTLGHAVLFISDFMQAGRFRSRIRAGDPRTNPKLQKELSRRVVHYNDYVPIAFLRWRRNTELIKNAKDDSGWELPLTEIENTVLHDRNSFPHKKFPWNYQIVSQKDAGKAFAVQTITGLSTDAAYLSKFNKVRPVFVKIDGLAGVISSQPSMHPASNTPQTFYKVEVEVLGDRALTSKNDFGTVGVTFADEPFTFTDIFYEPTVVALFRIFSITLGKTPELSNVALHGWSVVKLFADAYFLRNGRVALPVFEGDIPPRDVLETDSHSTEDLLHALHDTRRQQFIDPAAVLHVSMGDSSRQPEVLSKRGIHVASDAMFPSGAASEMWAELFNGALKEETNKRVVPPGTVGPLRKDAHYESASSNTAMYGELTPEQEAIINSKVLSYSASLRVSVAKRQSVSASIVTNMPELSPASAAASLQSPIANSLQQQSPQQSPQQKVSANSKLNKKSSIVLDGVSGIPLQSICTRVLIYFADLEGASASCSISNELLYDKPPEIVSVQSLDSLVAEPNFDIDNSATTAVGANSRAVVIIECAFGKTWATYGHAVLPVGNTFTKPGYYFTRVRPGDPRKPRSINSEVIDHSSIQRQRLNTSPQSADEYLPLALVRWRKDCVDQKIQAVPDPFCVPLTQEEHVIHKERATIALKRTPSSSQISTVATAKQLFDDAKKGADSGDAVSFVTRYIKDRSMFVWVESIVGMLESASADVIYKVLVCVGGATGFTRMHDLIAPATDPAYLVEPITFQGIECDEFACVWFTVFAVSTKPPKQGQPLIRPVAWSVAKLFVDQQFLRQARISIPLFHGVAPPKEFVEELAKAPIEQTVVKYLFSEKIRYFAPRALLQIAQGDSARFGEVTARYTTVSTTQNKGGAFDVVLGPYINQSKVKLVRKSQMTEFEGLDRKVSKPDAVTLGQLLGKSGDAAEAFENDINDKVTAFLSQGNEIKNLAEGGATKPSLERKPSFFARLFS